MADIELVIKMPEEIYKGLFDNEELTGGECAWLLSAVKNGTPLPKGYGKYDELKEAIQKIKEEIQEKINQEIYSDGTPSEYAYCYDSVLDIIDNHLKGVEDFHEPDIRDETELER